MAELVFILSVLLIVYTYAGYPLLLALMPERSWPDHAGCQPPVSIILSVFRGERVIEQKLKNTFDTDYPQQKLEMIVVLDGSDDGTADKLEALADKRVRVIRQSSRQGKMAAQKTAVASAAHDILIFTDLTTMLAPDSISRIVHHFGDPSVGLVSSHDIWVDENGQPASTCQGAYIKYEMWIRDRESAVNSIVSASGCFYAVRKRFFEFIPDYLIDDTVVPMTVAERGARCVHDKRAVSYVPVIPSADREFTRRIRIALGGINALMYKGRLLNPFRYGFLSIQLWSHKLLRWLVPVFMVLIFLANLHLAGKSSLWNSLLVTQVTVYLIAFIGYWMREAKRTPRMVKLVYFFVSSNLALLCAWWQFLTNRKPTTWVESRS
jgi:cellulose synthase/poly-beta-1,6-N-acetylglucosamine synthase-like glycosyltransferase